MMCARPSPKLVSRTTSCIKTAVAFPNRGDWKISVDRLIQDGLALEHR